MILRLFLLFYVPLDKKVSSNNINSFFIKRKIEDCEYHMRFTIVRDIFLG